MTLWERERARKLAQRSIKQALDREGFSPRNPLEAVAQSALMAQKNGNLPLWVEVCLAVASELSESYAVTKNLIARARSQSKVSEHVFG